MFSNSYELVFPTDLDHDADPLDLLVAFTFSHATLIQGHTLLAKQGQRFPSLAPGAHQEQQRVIQIYLRTKEPCSIIAPTADNLLRAVAPPSKRSRGTATGSANLHRSAPCSTAGVRGVRFPTLVGLAIVPCGSSFNALFHSTLMP